ncbi:hypothetical protein V6N13_064296 [Hibiscus sabdariffa]
MIKVNKEPVVAAAVTGEGSSAGGAKVQTTPPPNADRGLFVRAGGQIWCSEILHRPCFEDDFEAISVSKRRDIRTNQTLS